MWSACTHTPHMSHSHSARGLLCVCLWKNHLERANATASYLRVYMYMCEYMYIYICIYRYIHKYMHVYTCVHEASCALPHAHSAFLHFCHAHILHIAECVCGKESARTCGKQIENARSQRKRNVSSHVNASWHTLLSHGMNESSYHESRHA